MRSVKILVSGWYGCENTGDDAILDGIIDTITSLGFPAEVTALTYGPIESRQSDTPVRTRPHLPSGFSRGFLSAVNGSLAVTLGAFRKADLLLLGGGGFLADWQREAPWLWLRQLILAKAMGAKTMLYGLGAGPFLTRRGRILTRTIINRCADHVTVRDERSRRWLLDIGVEKQITTTGDPSFRLSQGTGGDTRFVEGLKTTGAPLFGISAIPLFTTREWGFRTDRFLALKQGLSELVEYISGTLGYYVLGIPFMKMDREFLLSITSSLNRESRTILDPGISPLSLLPVFANLEAFIGMRYHSLLFSALTATPFFGIIYHHKGRELIRDLDMEPFSQEVGDGKMASDRDLEVDLAKESIGRLITGSEAIREKLQDRTGHLKEREQANGRLLKRILEEIGRSR